MKLMIDTNIIIDFFTGRKPFADDAEKVLMLCFDGKVEGFVTASSITDIFYISRKVLGNQVALERLALLMDFLTIAEVGKKDIQAAMNAEMPDFEDALVSVCARRIRASYVVTRDIKDFSNSSVKAISPKEFLALI